MNYYKDTKSAVFALDSAAEEHFLPAGCVPITKEEAAVITNPTLPIEQQNAPIITEIQALEATTLRAIREFILGDASAKVRLQAIEDQIAAKRVKLKKPG